MVTLAERGPEEAWARSFAPMAETLDETIFKYMKAGDYETRVVKVPLAAPAVASVQDCPARAGGWSYCLISCRRA